MNWSEAKILYKFASRSRPKRFFEALDSIVNNSSQLENCVVVCTFDTDDQTMDADWVKEKILTYPIKLIIHRGVSVNKIAAVNKNLENLHDCKIIVNWSDDMVFIKKGFDDIIRQDFAEQFPNGDGFIHYPDNNQGSACATMNVTDSIFFNRFGYIYHPDYVSVECDLENQEVAQMLGRYKFVEKRIFNHNHPSFGLAPYDEQYNRTENEMVHEGDKATRRRRKANNYDLIKTESGWTTKQIEIMALTGSNGEVIPDVIEDNPPMTVDESISKLQENVTKTQKLRDKFYKKLGEVYGLVSEVNELGIIKIQVQVTEESLK